MTDRGKKPPMKDAVKRILKKILDESKTTPSGTASARGEDSFPDLSRHQKTQTTGKGGEYIRTTNNVTVTVEPIYLDNESSPDESLFVWAYRVKITNEGSETLRLCTRYWRITDAHGLTHEVSGQGVVGEQPVLKPGESYEYTSGTPLATPTGFMVGTYHMRAESGQEFDVHIPAFSLDSPHHRPQFLH